MVILIGGASHTGKTLMMKKLVERTSFPALSLDHLKMGLIRAKTTDLTPEDDEALTAFLWPIAAEMIKTVIENRQDLILEGCYIPADWANCFEKRYLKEIRAAKIILSEKYIRDHFGVIQRTANAAEYRMREFLDREELIQDNARQKKEAEENKTPFVYIQDRFDPDEVYKELTSLLGL